MAHHSHPPSTPNANHYYVPHSSKWPIVGSIGLFFTAIGAANFIQQSTNFVTSNTGSMGGLLLLVGLGTLIFMMIGWFGDTIRESLAGMNSQQLSISYRMGMKWFIFSEVMFFAAFFGTLFYTRHLSIPWLAGAGAEGMTHEILWPDFQAMWPLVKTPDGRTLQAMSPWGLPLINTILLIASSILVTIAHHALLENKRGKVITHLGIALILGAAFMYVQGVEYYHAYTEMGLTLEAGIYGSTFFMLTGFHGLHVTIGAIMLLIMWIRCLKGHFTPENHFAFEAAAWYWHFVDVVWIFLFFVVYWL
jgi:cytochrome c oxidase subunit III